MEEVGGVGTTDGCYYGAKHMSSMGETKTGYLHSELICEQSEM